MDNYGVVLPERMAQVVTNPSGGESEPFSIVGGMVNIEGSGGAGA